jgi:hypothetical protein
MNELAPIMATVADLRACRLCARGMRTWLEHHGFDVTEFVRDGIAVERLEATGDHFALQVCMKARERALRT